MKIAHGWLTCLLVLGLVALGGCSGDDGKTGPVGADGAVGADGMDGLPGKPGTNGTNGKDGVDGTDGMDGMPGAVGMDGEDGDAGAEGHDGHDGMTGPAGPSGIINRTKLTGNATIYPLLAQQTSGVTGSVRFAEFVDGAVHATLVTIKVSGPITGDMLRVAHIHYNDVATGGSPAVTLNKVDGFTSDGTAMSETLVSRVDPAAANAADPAETFVAGAAITYTDFVGTGAGTGFNGYVNVHVVLGDPVAGNTNPTTAVAAGDIGKNF